MAGIQPIAIKGSWQAGFALDYHTVSSKFLGHNEFGHAVFETKRTELGELLYRLKFGGDKSVVDEIAETAAHFVQHSWGATLSMIVPVLPSNEGRSEQPVFILADALGKRLRIPVRHDAVVKQKKTPQLKNIYDYKERLKVLDGAFAADPSVAGGHSILLFDDLYRSGATMSTVTRALQEQGKAAEVYALVLTRTRKNA